MLIEAYFRSGLGVGIVLCVSTPTRNAFELIYYKFNDKIWNLCYAYDKLETDSLLNLRYAAEVTMAFDFKKEYKEFYMPKKKKLDCSSAEYITIDEGLCVQMMHLGPFDDEPATVAIMDAHLEQNGYVNDFSQERLHHEIYMSDARKVAPEKWKTVIRHPIRKA